MSQRHKNTQNTIAQNPKTPMATTQPQKHTPARTKLDAGGKPSTMWSGELMFGLCQIFGPAMQIIIVIFGPEATTLM